MIYELFEYVDINQISDKNKKIINKDFHKYNTIYILMIINLH